MRVNGFARILGTRRHDRSGSLIWNVTSFWGSRGDSWNLPHKLQLTPGSPAKRDPIARLLRKGQSPRGILTKSQVHWHSLPLLGYMEHTFDKSQLATIVGKSDSILAVENHFEIQAKIRLPEDYMRRRWHNSKGIMQSTNTSTLYVITRITLSVVLDRRWVIIYPVWSISKGGHHKSPPFFESSFGTHQFRGYWHPTGWWRGITPSSFTWVLKFLLSSSTIEWQVFLAPNVCFFWCVNAGVQTHDLEDEKQVKYLSMSPMWKKG